jgi:hypothetical protein
MVTTPSSAARSATSMRLPPLLLGHRGDGFGRVLDDVRHRLGDETPVDVHGQRPLREVFGKDDLGMRDSHHEGHLPHDLDDIVFAHTGLGHPREGRKLVDHALDVVDLAHDRIGTLIEDLPVGHDHLAVLAADTLRRELDRG